MEQLEVNTKARDRIQDLSKSLHFFSAFWRAHVYMCDALEW